MLIRCPECGHQVSDKAPLCPNCGVEIAGKVTQSPEEEEEEKIIATPIIEDNDNGYEDDGCGDKYVGDNDGHDENHGDNGKSGRGSTLIVSAIIAAIICGIGLYFYKDAIDRAKYDEKVVAEKKDTTAAVVEDDTADENTWTITEDTIPSATTTEEENVAEDDDAAEEKTETEEETLTETERSKATTAVRKFLQAMNSHDRDALKETLSYSLSHFNGKQNATRTDAIQYMVDLYQADVKNLNWHIDRIADVEKRKNDVGDTEYSVLLNAIKETVREGGTSKHRFVIKATVNAEGKITAANITRE